MYASRSETLISTPVPGLSITHLQQKTWFTVEPNSAPVSQCPDPQYMTPTNTYTSLYVGQNWSNIRSFGRIMHWRSLLRTIWVDFLQQ
jgi:hypothetical protein